MGFAACTNEVEEFVPQVQDKDYPGVDLGEDFAINVTNSDFSADAETRAEMVENNGKWIASWGNDANGNADRIGAAWFNKYVKDADGKVINPVDVKTQLQEYGSNAEFIWQSGNSFKSEAICKMGTYVLYYPFNEAITDNMTTIPTKEIKAEQDFDCADIDCQVNKNVFAANVVRFDKSSALTPEFTVKQIPNLYALSFYINDESLLKLDKKVQITHVVVEAFTEAGKPAFNTVGTIAPTYTNITASTYNRVEGAPAMPEIDFDGTAEKRVERVTIAVKNSTDDYCITNTGKSNGTDKFYFSLLPTEQVSKVSFKVISKVNKKTVVFGKTIEGLTPTDTKTFDNKMAAQGEVVNVAVELDHEFDIEDGLYSVDQFVEAWKNEETVFNLAVDMDLSTLSKKTVDFTNIGDKHLVFMGKKVTMPSIKGKYTFLNEVKINGNAELTYCPACENGWAHTATSFAQKAEIIGNVTSCGQYPVWFRGETEITGNVIGTEKSSVTFGPGVKAKITGNYTANYTTQIYANTEITGTVTANAELTFVNDAKIGNLVAEAPVTFKKAQTLDITANDAVTFNGDATTGAIEANEDVTFNGAKNTISALTVNEDAEVTATDATITTLTVNKGVVTIPTLTANDITVELEGELESANKLNVTGIATANGKIVAAGEKINTLAVNHGVTVDLNGGEIAVLNVNKTASYFGTLNLTGDVKIAGGENKGTINGAYTVNGTFTQSANADNNVITVAEGATFVVNANTNADITNNGTVTINKDKVLKDVTAIINNGTINANGTLKEVTNVTLAAKSKVIVGAAGKVNLIGAQQLGEVKVQNGSQLTYASDLTQPAKVSYEWNGTAPDATVENVINYYNIKNASALMPSKFNDNSTIDLAGTMSLKMSLDFNAKNIELIVSENSTIAQGDAGAPAQVKNLKLTSTGNSKVKSGATLTVSDLINLTAGTLKLESGAEFVGNPGGASVTH